MTSLGTIQTSGHELVSIFQDRSTGLLAIIAVHDTTLGPGLGGCRLRDYDSLDEAVYDVLRLAEGMTFKNSLAGLDLGGGKSVIVRNRHLQEGREELFLKFGECVQSVGGKYITAEDMGTTVEDIEVMRRVTQFVSGTDPAKGGGGNPSPYTARGVFDGMRACVEREFGSADLSGRHVVVQGLGAVGRRLSELLAEAGAKLSVADTRSECLVKYVSDLGAKVVPVDAVYDVECDVFAPCAVGGILNSDTVPRLRAKIVAGAANNQLETRETEQLMADRGILYAPDFAINAGGVILCADEVEPGGFTQSRVDERVARIGATVGSILDEAKLTSQLAGAVAEAQALRRIEAARSS